MKETRRKRWVNSVFTTLLSFMMVWTMIPGLFLSGTTAFAAAGDVPDHEKSISNNGDGTYKLALNVTGDSEKQIQKVNVIVIVDRSGSMNSQSGTGAYVATTSTGTGLYGYIDGEYVPLERRGTPGNRTFWYNGVQYTGQRYQYDSTATRLQATQAAVNGLAGTLLDYNGKDGNPSDTVEMALVTFGSSAQTNVAKTSDRTAYINAVNGITVATGDNAGTNWEGALQEANGINFGDSDPTYVIFFSDGAPTFRYTQGSYNDRYGNTNYYGTGQEQEPNMSRSYNAATDDASTLANKVGTDRFYTIFAYGTDAGATYMTNLTSAAGAPAGNNYSASSTAELNDAFAEILESIEMAGIGSVEIDDGTTNKVTTASGVVELLEVDETSYQYWRAGGTDADGNEKYDSDANTIDTMDGNTQNLGEEWTGDDVPAAELVDGEVQWDLSSVGILENDVTYTVTFDVYPSQTTYDYIAQLKNGDIQYNELPPEVRQYLIEVTPGVSYTLKTNTAASLSYDDTRDTEGTQKEDYNDLNPVATDASQMSITKAWENELDARKVGSIEMTVLMGDEEFHKTTLSADSTPAWTEEPIYISTGLMRTKADDSIQILDTGHDFTFAELGSEQYNWELVTPVMHPMIIDGTLTMLIMVDDAHPAGSAKTYELDGKTYYVAGTGEASLNAYNYRRSNLNLTKVVTGEDAPEDATFPFTLTVNNSKADSGSASDLNSDYYVWFSIDSDPSEDVFAPVTDANVSGDGVVQSGNYWYAPSGTAITVEMQAGWNLRFTNLPTGTTYTFEEGDLAEGFAFNNADLTNGEDSTFDGNKTSTGTIENTNTSYEVTYTNDYELTDLEITKVWEDEDNQDGIRLTADELKAKLTLSPTVEGKEPTVTDNGNGTYTITYTGLPRFNNGTEVEYTVAESAIDGYTTEGSPAEDHGTITNTHEPEVTSVTVVKEWDDSDDIGKIRPASIQAQLKADGTASGDPVTLNEDNEWTYTWENLPKYSDGEEIVYTADETAVPTGYTKSGPEKTTAEDGTVTFTVTNTYNPTPVSVDPPVQKVITNNEDLYNGGDFTFTIEATSPTDAPMPAKTSITNVAENEVDGKTGFYEFGEITFTKPGTYTYTVKESGSVDGVTNDPDAATGKTLTFTVEDDGTGKLTVTPTTDQVQLSFTNVYDANGEATIVVNKEVQGAAWPEGKTLTLTLAGTGNAPMPETTTAELTSAGAATFGSIKYGLSDAGKTYTYTVTESSFGAGWSGAPASITAEVAVTDNGDGTLGTTVTYSPEDATFTNTYRATGSATLKATKAIEGAAWPSGKTITFTLDGEGGTLPTTKTVSLSEPGEASFGAINYTEADAGKTYTYTISEDGFGKGWTGSPEEITATVVVTDNGDGTLSTEVSYSPEDDTITNTYEASGSAVIEVTKALSGAEWPEGKTLTFTLAGEGGTLPETTTVDLTAAGKATFDPITYTAADAGKTYTYTVTESSFGAGWTGSPDEITARVSVTDNGDGTLSTSVTYTPENATFTNTYDATGKINLGATKVLEGEGRTLQPDEFSFTVYDAAGSVVATGTNDAQGNVTFGDINYTLADAGKAFNYTIKENIPEGADEKTHKLGNIIYDPTEYPVTVTVTDNGEGELVAEADKTAAQIVFTNKYVPDPVSATVNINKTLTGVRALKAGEFSFTMVPDGTVAGDPVPAEGLTAAVDADGTAAISAVYTRADTYTYTVSEDIPDDEHKLGGVTYDETKYPVTVTVTDEGGKLVATVSPESVAFTNEYVTKGDAEIDIKKVFEGKNWTDEEEFTIDLYDSTGEKIDSKTLTKDEQTGKFEIKDLTPGTYTYKLKEVVPGSENTSEEQPAEGEQTTEGEQTQDAASENAGAAGTEAAPEEAQTETPTEEGTPATTEEVNTDDAAAQAEAPAAEETPATSEEAKAEEEVQTGSIFERLLLVAYAAEGDEETAEEGVVETENGKITYDTKEYNVSIEVTDNGDGTCTAAVKYPDGDVVTFNNQYTPNPATVNPEATKTLTGKDLTKGMFQFRLKGNGTNVVVANDADGKVTFPQLSYIKDDAGKTYEYTVSEIKGDLGGVTYDETVYTFTVSVEYDADAGKLTATMSGADGMSFVNTYKPEDVTVNLKAHKTLEGVDLTKGEFAFVVESTDGEVVASATNDANGNVTFGGLKFTEEGTYTYKIKEVNTEVENFEYDDSVYTATITVTDDKNGKLVAKVSIDGGSAEFINTYTPPEEPEEPEEPTPGAKTGDDNNIGGWLALMALAAAGGSGLLIMRRREDEE